MTPRIKKYLSTRRRAHAAAIPLKACAERTADTETYSKEQEVVKQSINSEVFARMLDDLLWLLERRHNSFPDGLDEVVDAMGDEYFDYPKHYSDGSLVDGGYVPDETRSVCCNRAILPPHRRGHFHVLCVWEPGTGFQGTSCSEERYDLASARRHINEVAKCQEDPPDAIWIVGCGDGRCRVDEIHGLPVEEWGEPHWTRWSESSTPDGV